MIALYGRLTYTVFVLACVLCVTAPIGGSATVVGLGAGAVGCWATSGNVVTTLATKNTNALTRTLLLLGSVPGEAVVLRGPALERGLLVVGEDLHDIGANESAQAVELGTHRIPHRSHGRVPLVQDGLYGIPLRWCP